MTSRLRTFLGWLPAPIRKLVVIVIGGTVLLIGIAMIVLPGPATVVIPAGLLILSLEFVWARRLVERAKVILADAKSKAADALKTRPPSGPGQKPS